MFRVELPCVELFVVLLVAVFVEFTVIAVSFVLGTLLTSVVFDVVSFLLSLSTFDSFWTVDAEMYIECVL